MEGEKPAASSLGSSLLVPSVQELVKKQQLHSVPSRYIHTDQYRLISSHHNDDDLAIPIIDLGMLICGDDQDHEIELNKLDFACKEWGFFQLKNHGVSSMLMEKVKAEMETFFNLPMEEKRKYWQQPGGLEGFGQHFVVSEDQKLDWGDMFWIITSPIFLRNPSLFPSLPQSFRETMEAYSEELNKIATKLFGKMAKALKMKGGEMDEIFEGGMQSMRMNYYPPCPQPELAIGLSPHSDSTGLTILFQANETVGLEIMKNGKWISITPLPDTFIVNIGDVVEIVSNGAYRSILHRAVVNSSKERLSIATFHNPNLEKELGPAPSLITIKSPASFKKVGVSDYFKEMFSYKLQGKSHLDSMRI
ncbi:protein SRG1-like [Impatiens glandulifera]|uniref:protein SRG1-like n=1 Tax=Impatiens glandulifera TaxID=253017 RepID=UPI001FB17E2C|nr:protein SRG1-like [Impatiens glandulifera]